MDIGREVSLPSSTVGCKDLMRWASESFRSSGGSLGGSTSWTGFEAFGSSPALRAFTIRKAWNLAYFDLAAISWSKGFCHIFRRSKKVAAAW